MEKALVDRNMSVLTNQQTPEVLQPCKGALNFPTFAIASQSSSVLKAGLSAPGTMRANQFNVFCFQSLSEFFAVIGPVGNHANRLLLGPSRTLSGHLDTLQGAFSQSHFSWRCRGNLASERNTRAVDHHHPLRTFSAFGFTHAEPPFLAEAKLPSKNTSLQFKVPWASRSARKRRQIRSHTPWSSHCLSRLQQVAALGYCDGKSLQRAPLRKTHKIPSKVCRLSDQGRPLLRGRGSNGSTLAHCLSLSNCSAIHSFSWIQNHLYSRN